MRVSIPDKVLRETKKCNKNFKCLFYDKKCLCPVTRVVGNYGVIFIESSVSKYCPYKIPFGDAQICSCPTRCELAKQMEEREKASGRKEDAYKQFC